MLASDRVGRFGLPLYIKAGTYMCEADAKAAGDRAALNEHHP